MAYPARTYRIDLDTQRIVGTIDGREACLQFIKKTLSTDKYSWAYYNQYFGNQINLLMGKSKGYIMAKFPVIAEQALLPDDRIVAVHDFEYEDDDEEGDVVKVSFWITTIYSEEYYKTKFSY